MAVLDHEVREAPVERPRTRRRLLLAGTAVIVLAGAGAVLALRGGSGGGRPAAAVPATAAVVRTDLAERTPVDGTLGYAKTYTVTAAGHGRVITWVPAVGDTIRRGQRMYGVDGHTVPLFYGPTPLWRELKSGMSDGKDVREVQSNLSALGYGDGLTINDHFSAATQAAIKQWQEDLGVSQTGTVQPGDVVVQPGALRITTVTAVPGGANQGPLLTATSTAREITVKLPVNQQELAVTGAQVEVTLPGGKTRASGHITSAGTVATSTSSGQTGQGTQTATIPVYITLDRPSAAGRLDGAPVTVGFTSNLHKAVLAVPVTALLGSPDGSYAVKVVDASGRTRRVPVQLGIFADSNVEVSGDLAEGMRVEVPRT